MRREQHRERVRDVRHRLAHDGPPWTRDRADFDTVTFPERDCDALRDLLIAEGVETVAEVGLAYGSSALAIGEALVSVAARRPRHVRPRNGQMSDGGCCDPPDSIRSQG